MDFEHLNVLHTDPRRLSVETVTPVLRCFVIVLHAPWFDDKEGCSSQHQVRRWWSATQRIVGQHARTSRQTLVCVDYNASLGNARLRGAGGSGHGAMSKHAPPFVNFLHTCSLLAPATFSEYTDTTLSKHTYLGGGKCTPRTIDDVLCSDTLCPARCASGTWKIDMGQERSDHLPTVSDIWLSAEEKQLGHVRRRVPYDKRATLNVNLAEEFSHAVRQHPTVPAWVEPSTHAHFLSEFLVGEAETRCPSSSQVPHKKHNWLTDDTLNAMKLRGSLHRRVARLRKHVQQAPVRTVFRVFRLWVCGVRIGNSSNYSCVFGFCTKKDLRATVDAQLAYQNQVCYVKTCVQYDGAARVQLIADQQRRALREGTLTQLYSLTKQLRPLAPKRLSRASNCDAHPSKTLREEQEAFAVHFSDLMRGTPTTMAELCSQERASCQNLDDRRLPVAFIPSSSDVVASFSHATRYNATGEYLMGPELFRCAPHATAQLYHPLYVKCHALQRFPIQYAGGQVVPLFKGKGPSSVVANYRDIRVATYPGKVLEGYLRSVIAPIVSSVSLTTQ